MFQAKEAKATYRIEIAMREPQWDAEAREVLHVLRESGLDGINEILSMRVYVIHGDISPRDADRAAREFFADPVVEMYAINRSIISRREPDYHTVEVARLPGVMEPVEASALKGLRDLGISAEWIRTARRYLVIGKVAPMDLSAAVERLLANTVIEEVHIDSAINMDSPKGGAVFQERREVDIAAMSDADLLKLSKDGQLHLSLEEMRVARDYFTQQGRKPSEIELETIAQTWSEHCVHKTFRGRVIHKENNGSEEVIDNLLKKTVFQATKELDKEWCWSVFVDNAGVIDFDGENGLVFKVETHNHPSAIEPYGGAGTGIGGVIRDPLGTGLGAKPILNTDVFCFGLPDLPQDQVPKGALHPRRVMKGVVAGVRDYGNRMGIPTANGAVLFDNRFTGNPLVFCGNLGVIPREAADKRSPRPGQIALVVGGRTGRDGIHGATFSSVELDEHSEVVSSGAVQIGNPIEEKKVADFLLRARDAGLYSCVTDCGAGGLSSALGEMASECGARVDLEKVPLKYDGLSHSEIWISEAQERMVISVDKANLPALRELAREENVEVAEVAVFTDDMQLRLCWDGREMGRLDLAFLHDGCPRLERRSEWVKPNHPEPAAPEHSDFTASLKAVLGSWNVCSKEWIIRQYDHEVQGTSVIKPLVGKRHDGPGDAAVITPILGSRRAAAVANGINPAYSDIDPYWMAAAAIDEALRNIVAVGASLDRCAILDNFCWGNCDKPDRLGGLVRAARACRDIAVAYGVPFISGKDSLNNEFASGGTTVAIPGTLLVSALAVMDDAGKALSMDAKDPGNAIYIVGLTRPELGGSRFHALSGMIGNAVPVTLPEQGLKVFKGISTAARHGLIRSAHDCSDGGLAVAAAEMAFAGERGMSLSLNCLPTGGAALKAHEMLFSESTSRLLIEVEPGKEEELTAVLTDCGAPFARLGEVTDDNRFVVRHNDTVVVNEVVSALKAAWQAPLAW